MWHHRICYYIFLAAILRFLPQEGLHDSVGETSALGVLVADLERYQETNGNRLPNSLVEPGFAMRTNLFKSHEQRWPGSFPITKYYVRITNTVYANLNSNAVIIVVRRKAVDRDLSSRGYIKLSDTGAMATRWTDETTLRMLFDHSGVALPELAEK